MTGSPPLIVGLGEALYDLLPAGPALGGAPLNAAVQSHQLGNNAVVASRNHSRDYRRELERLARLEQVCADGEG